MVAKSVSGPSKYLLIDVGNTRIKYAWFHSAGQQQYALHYCDHAKGLDADIKQATFVFIASVARPDVAAELSHLAKTNNIPFKIIQTEAQSFGIQCAYTHFNHLGVDRWLAVLAARCITSKPCAVLDLGTAATCDFVVGSEHVGGWIAPGFNLMRRSLFKDTANVFGNDEAVSELRIGNATPDCVNYGGFAMLSGFVHQAEAVMRNRYDDYCLIVAGGNAEMMKKEANDTWLVRNDVVLLGMSHWISLHENA
ncbi:type III pantothenate kinase [Aestuariibacter sp. AA17]|uniref:Type III pantothenate kinase n=1 Tax=Fluctibacter corallii TaxID=2984329 RepID=A0ABT3ADC8_9ALTE|nr:type III pantothenate kinase [Aestuariibacter sp. AA17]MCV2886676.1 type III pantothenate kinase [Aestuariibacter sp. AA17]